MPPYDHPRLIARMPPLTTLRSANVPVIPVGAGTPFGFGYTFFASSGSVNGIAECTFNYNVKASSVGFAVDQVLSNHVAVHYFASKSAILPGDASLIRTWLDDDNDLLTPPPDPVGAQSDFIFLKSRHATIEMTFENPISTAIGAPVAQICSGVISFRDCIPCFPKAPADRLFILAVMIAAKYVDQSQSQCLLSDWSAVASDSA